jgi:hypothetical protein
MSGRGFTRRFGESVCAPTTRYGVCGRAPSGTYHATTAPPRTTNFPPASPSHASVSATRRNPAFSNRPATAATAW